MTRVEEAERRHAALQSERTHLLRERAQIAERTQALAEPRTYLHGDGTPFNAAETAMAERIAGESRERVQRPA
jgi:FKBP-type peptidyl-prolyl cis-trans isomerase 2